MYGKRKFIFIAIILGALTFFLIRDIYKHRDFIDAFSGATPQALEIETPRGLQLTVDGRVKHPYIFTSSSLNLLAKTRIRTCELSPEGNFMGTYIHIGIPLLHILEGVAPVKNKTDAFDRPLDLIIRLTGADGKSADFSYGELTMCTDALPPTLAYYREPLLPSKDPGTYQRNRYKEPLTGLRLICPRDKTTGRYLDNVTHMTLFLPSTPDSQLPKMEKNKKCRSESLLCVTDALPPSPIRLEGATVQIITDWIRIGHGKGIRDDNAITATGYPLRPVLLKNFPGCTAEDFFLFIGCDGYRAIFSGHEIFNTPQGEALFLLDSMKNQLLENGFCLGSLSDFFVDRNVQGISRLVRIKKEAVDAGMIRKPQTPSPESRKSGQ